MTGERDLDRLLATMEPELRPGRYVFASVGEVPVDCDPVVLVREAEGTTLVLEQAEADGLGLPYEYVAAMISLRVHSALDAVGLTAAVATALAEAGMSCNVVAGYFHDHLFVPYERRAEAVDLLRARRQAPSGVGCVPSTTSPIDPPGAPCELSRPVREHVDPSH
jgi:uncharacterized protein